MCFKAPKSPVPQIQQATAAIPQKAPAAAPPVTERSTEVLAASRQTRVDAMKRKGVRSTLLAGETGGYGALEEKQPTKTLLG